jgi:N12 class adenine-specific DNA methylase
VSEWPGPVTRARASLRALEALDRISARGGTPSDSDLDDLRGWAGWGPMAPAFSSARRDAWRQIGERLEWLLPPDQLREAEQATPNAFYTPPALAQACWQILTGLGSDHGRVLEPGCGAGAFLAAAPDGIEVTWTGVERDPVTARIAQLLHPAARIISDRLQNAALPAHSADAVIGNVPFGETAVYDPTAPKDVTKSLHNYCIWRSARTLRPGGVAVLITSRYTMDARDTRAREAIAAEADLIGAIRLPNNALSPGGTEVLADILVLRRRDEGTTADDGTPRDGRTPEDKGISAARPDWMETVLLSEAVRGQAWGYQDRINQWFVAHPGAVLGELRPDHAALYGRTVRVDRPAGAGPLGDALAGATRRLVTGARERGLAWSPPAAVVPDAGGVGIPERADGRKERSFHLTGSGAACQVQDGVLVPVDRQGRELAELTALIRLRNATVGLLDAEADHGRGEESLGPLRAALNTAYDHYTSAYGPLNRATISRGEPDPETGFATVSRRRPRMGGFRQDPDYVTVLALEAYDDETGQAVKTAIFSQRVNRRTERKTRAESPDEAIRLCLDARGRLDLPVIAGLLGIPAGQVPAEITGLAYLDPASGDWVTAEEYLSGNVRGKLEAARATAASGSGREAHDWSGNIAALEQVQPADLSPGEIRAKLGAPWIPPADIRAFATEILGYAPVVSYLPVTAQWEIKTKPGMADTAAGTDEWGTSRIDGYRLLELAVNGKAPVIYDTVQGPDGEIRVRNQAETMLAEEKQRALSTRFGEWAWEDPERSDRLCAEYNRRFNSVVLRRYDGSHLTSGGMTAAFMPYPHQLDMVHRILSTPACLCPYPVGTGKTPVMFMAARKLRELGLARKPLIIVPNHLLEQTAREGKRLFPSARILIVAREDLAGAQERKLFAARCATGDWDAVVMTHSAFTAIPVHPATEAAHLTDLAARYRQALTSDPDGGSRRTVKQLAKMIDSFETRARTLLAHRTDDGVWFEHLGCDVALVDESHYFKNLGVPVRTDGFSVAASKRATDLDLKLSLLRGRGGKVATLFTGTPVTNSLLEMYVLQHYLYPERLAELGLDSADAWAATFVEFRTSVEVTPDGASFRLKRRPARFENVPELLTLFGEAADLRPPESFAVQRPEGRHHNVVIGSSPELRAYVASLAERADKVRQADPHDDNMLKICSDGRKAALDLELVGIATARPGKVGAVAGNVARIYHANSDLALPGDDPADPGGGFQIVFCDLGTPNPAAGTQVYGKIKAGLTAAGVPSGKVRFIHDATTDAQRTALFADCRSGKVAVLLGSTDKLGVGTNIQSRCVAVHHVDAPWRPADVEQREGRALRPGNLNPVVEVFRYVSEKSFDSFFWQVLERKSRFIGQVLGGRPAGRDVDDIGDATLSYAEVKALATGNPLLLELAEANAQVTRLRQLATAHTRATRRLAGSAAAWQQQAAAKTRLASTWARIADPAQASSDLSWRDQAGHPIPGDLVAGHLARLTGEAMAPEPLYRPANWRGLQIRFAAERSWRQAIPVATISAGPASVPVQLNAAWTAKGQHWRIEKEITTAITGAGATADALRGEVRDLRQRAADATRRISEPFPQAAELEAARARRDAIEQDIRDAAAPQDDSAAAQAGADGLDDAAANDEYAAAGLDGATMNDALAMAGMHDAVLTGTLATDEITFVPALISPQAAAPAGDDWRADQPITWTGGQDVPVPPAADGEPAARAAVRGDVALTGGDLAEAAGAARAGDRGQPPGGWAGLQGQPPAPEVAAPEGVSSGDKTAPPRPVMHPVFLARRDLTAEPLFSLPAAAQRPAGREARGRPAAQPRAAQRAAAQAAAQDDAVQPALFDLPPQTPEPGLAAADNHRPARAPRK